MFSTSLDLVDALIAFIGSVFVAALLALALVGIIEMGQSYRARYRTIACSTLGLRSDRAFLSDSVVCAPRVGGQDSITVKVRQQ